uniref:hypothetical protein n=1 Tax=Agathobacter sp. TaxID=2021311 RepID=UPI004056EF8A
MIFDLVLSILSTVLDSTSLMVAKEENEKEKQQQQDKCPVVALFGTKEERRVFYH